jgi:hypothetical protein
MCGDSYIICIIISTFVIMINIQKSIDRSSVKTIVIFFSEFFLNIAKGRVHTILYCFQNTHHGLKSLYHPYSKLVLTVHFTRSM